MSDRFGRLYDDMSDPNQVGEIRWKIAEMKSYCEAYFPDALPYIDELLQFLEHFYEEYYQTGDRLKDLLQAIEEEASSDAVEADVYKAIAALKAQDDKDA